MFDYIEENLEKIKNPDDVNFIKPASPEGKGTALWARLNNGEAVRLTETKGIMTFPWEPIYWLARERLGKFYFKTFGSIDNQLAINKKHLIRLGYVDNNKKRINTCAYFDDGRIVTLYQPLRKYFFKKLKPDMEQEFGMQVEDMTEESRQENELNQ